MFSGLNPCILNFSPVVMQTILVLKYVVPQFPPYFGYANVGQNIAIMLSAVVLWLAQSAPSDYEYNLSI